MNIVLYNAEADVIIIVESDEETAVLFSYVLSVKNNKYGWICLGEL